MQFFPAIKKFYTCFTFDGRSTRSEICWPVLLNTIIGFIFMCVLFAVIGETLPPAAEIQKMSPEEVQQMLYGLLQTKLFTVYMPILSLYNLYVFVCTIFAYTRRLHDLNKSGWHYLWLIVPIIGVFFFLWLLFAKGTKGPNAYGQDPLEAASSNAPSQQA